MQAVVFDADGVLIHGRYFVHQYEEDFGFPADKIIPFFHGPFQQCLIGEADLQEEIAPYLPKWGWDGTVEELLWYWFQAEDQLHRGVMDVVERLQMRDLPCYVATNQEQYRTRYMRYAMDFDTEFERLFSSAEIGAKKPEEVFYHAVHDYIADEHGIAKDDVLFWDDEEANVEAAANYGWDAKLFKDVSSFTAVMEDRLD